MLLKEKAIDYQKEFSAVSGAFGGVVPMRVNMGNYPDPDGEIRLLPIYFDFNFILAS